MTNLDVINYYGDLPKDLLTFSDDGVLTVDPKKCTDQLLDATWQINVWAQTTNDKLIAEQMIKKTIKINCKHDDSVPRYAKITSQSDNCVTLACGSDQGEKEVKFDITYWSSIEGEYSFDNTIWSVTDRGDLPETCDLSFKNGETLGEGILTIDAQNCTLATNQVYNIKVQGQSTKCPSVVASANLEINLTGDVTPTEATILGSETVEVDPNAPSTYKFDYSCRVTNQGDETIDNSPLRWTLNEKQVKTLSDAGIDVEFKNNQLLVNTINCKSKEQQDYSLLLTATSLIDNTVEDSLPIDISVNKFDNTPANVELGGDANIFAKAGEEDDISVTFAPYVSNASHAKIDSITQGYNLTLAPDSEQSSKFAQSGIKHWMYGNILNLNTKDINIDYKQLQTNFTIKLIGNYSASGISFQTEHFLSLKVNPMNDEVVSSMTLAATTTTSARGVLGQKVSTNTPTFNPKLLNPSGVPLVRYQPVLTAEATPELPDGVNISFDANDDYRMIIDATNCSSLTDKNFKVEVSCKAYYDGETQKTVTPAKDNGSVTIDLTLTDTKNVIKLVNDNVIELKDFCNPNELCGIREGGVYWFHVTNKAGQIQEVSSNTIKEINIGFCDPSISAIGDNFLAGCTYLEKVDFTGLNNVFAVGNKTLYGCQSLAEIDLSPIEQLTTIGNEFMSSCTRIMNFKMTGLHKIRNIGSNFMNNCSMLQTVD